MHSIVWWYIVVQGLLQQGYLPAYTSLHAQVDQLRTNNLLVADEPIRAYGLVIAFYNSQDTTLSWQPEAIKQWLRIIEESVWEGLRPADYHYSTVLQLASLPNRTSQQQASLELLATDGFLLYLYHLYNGKLHPEAIDPNCHIAIQEGNPTLILSEALDKGNFYTVIDGARPTTPNYRALLMAHIMLSFSPDWPQWTGGKTIYPNDRDPRIALLYQRLLPHSLPNDTYQPPLVLALTQFQQAHGLTPDGIIGTATQLLLAMDRKQKMETLCVNMERWRWLPINLPDYYLFINVADFSLSVVRDKTAVAAHAVIVGRPTRKTPLFQATMRYLEFNPTWTVPPTILSEDVLPAVRKNTDYLAENNLLVYDENNQLIDPDSQDWQSKQVASFRYVQRPGSANALGVVKFIFPNPYTVFLHDTPHKALFQRTNRAFSSGCIRVNKPKRLAALLLQQQGWDSLAVQQAIDSRETMKIVLVEQPIVYVQYFTAWRSDLGTIYYRHDHYNLDATIGSALRMPLAAY